MKKSVVILAFLSCVFLVAAEVFVHQQPTENPKTQEPSTRKLPENEVADLSFSNWREKNRDNREKEAKKLIHPKLLYVHFVAPDEPKTFYYGFGGTWGTLRSESEGKVFSGILGNLDLGYELYESSTVRQMIDFDIAQPVLAFSRKGTLFRPTLEVAYSLGF